MTTRKNNRRIRAQHVTTPLYTAAFIEHVFKLPCGVIARAAREKIGKSSRAPLLRHVGAVKLPGPLTPFHVFDVPRLYNYFRRHRESLLPPYGGPLHPKQWLAHTLITALQDALQKGTLPPAQALLSTTPKGDWAWVTEYADHPPRSYFKRSIKMPTR